MKFDNLVSRYLGVLQEEEQVNVQPNQSQAQQAQPIDPKILNNPNFRNLWSALTSHENAANSKQNTTVTMQSVKDAYTKLPPDLKQYGDQLLSAHPDTGLRNIVKQYSTKPATATQQPSGQQNSSSQSSQNNNSGNQNSSTPAYKTGTPVG